MDVPRSFKNPFGLACVLAFAAIAHGQLPYSSAYVDYGFTNPTQNGSPVLSARVHFPIATTALPALASLVPEVGGRPVIVFLHGLGVAPITYSALSILWASNGYIVVVADTAFADPDLQRDDAIATFAALAAENQASGSPFFGAFDMARVGLAGHSMGGGNVLRVMATNPGYAAGCSLATWEGPTNTWPIESAPYVTGPILLIHGAGDTTSPWAASAQLDYSLAASFGGARAMYVMDTSADHQNVSIYQPGSSQTDLRVFLRAYLVSLGWFDRWLRDNLSGLDQVCGSPALGDSHFMTAAFDVTQPQVWIDHGARIGRTFSIVSLAAPGTLILAAAPTAVFNQTPLGPLYLDPATLVVLSTDPVNGFGVHTFSVPLPPDQALVGLQVFVQIAGFVHAGTLALSPPIGFTISN